MRLLGYLDLNWPFLSFLTLSSPLLSIGVRVQNNYCFHLKCYASSVDIVKIWVMRNFRKIFAEHYFNEEKISFTTIPPKFREIRWLPSMRKFYESRIPWDFHSVGKTPWIKENSNEILFDYKICWNTDGHSATWPISSNKSLFVVHMMCRLILWAKSNQITRI